MKKNMAAMELKIFKSLYFSAFFALLIRLAFMFYGIWQDKTMVVKYTDVDYYVFTDAARYTTQGESPYNRATYRYTPLLAYILQPNIWLTLHFGKIIFILCDVLTGVLMYKICLKRFFHQDKAIYASFLWLFNPMPIAVSSRGNAESILSLLVLLALQSLLNRRTILAAVIYGLAVHMKIYPVTYALPIYLFLNNNYDKTSRKSDGTFVDFAKSLLPGKSRLIFICFSVSTFLIATGLCYYKFGYQFLDETYLFHVTRRDTRHNFSPYFYMLYLTAESSSSLILGLMAFLPQLVLLIVLSFQYHRDLPLCCFLHTFIFVTFNKVCTSQYFLWYLCLLPVIIPTLNTSIRRAVLMIGAWFLGQGIWLLPAYFVEFKGQDAFIFIWMAGLIFFVINIWITGQIIARYRPSPIFPSCKLYQGVKRSVFVDSVGKKSR